MALAKIDTPNTGSQGLTSGKRLLASALAISAYLAGSDGHSESDLLVHRRQAAVNRR
jgi:hypothetical protein